MKYKSLARFGSTLAGFLAMALAIMAAAVGAQAGEKVILPFDKTHGSYPRSSLTADSAGNLYGTTAFGGAANCGTVFELSPGSAGKWTETVLYSFTGCDIATLTPLGTLSIDIQGNLYGVQDGFIYSGVVFELKKAANGNWSYGVLHNFGGNGNEGSPNGDLTWDGAGNLYGTTSENTEEFAGEAFELSPQPNGSWRETVLYTFPSPNGVGDPVAGVVFDKKGNLYGATFYGSKGAFGAVYELSPQASGPWTLTVLANFAHARIPNARLIFDSSGNLYGTTGQINTSEVFELSPVSGGTWKETTIHSFTPLSDGQDPVGALIFDASGNLYGATSEGGTGCNQFLCGTVFKLAPQSNGTWKETILHQFESATDGSEPQEGLILDNSGNLYGTTAAGGSRYGYGTVFEITP